MRKLKFFTGTLKRIEKRANAFFENSNVVSADVQLMRGRERWVAIVTYDAPSGTIPFQGKEPVLPKSIQRSGKRSAPTMTLARREKGGPPVTVELMAGVFPVIEGDKLWSGDDEPAPKPVLLPGSNLKSFGDLFGNVGDFNVYRNTGSARGATTGAYPGS